VVRYRTCQPEKNGRVILKTIYLADLVYDTVRTNYVVPLNVAYLAAYTKEKYGRDVDIKIFKYPLELEKKIKNCPPDILGLSNYSWNERLNQVFMELAKRQNPKVITVMGGPNIRTDRAGIEAYLSVNSLLDYYILFEGEEPFANLVGQVLAGGDLSVPPVGCAGLVEGRLHFESVNSINTSKHINYPSPYLSGLLDDFLVDPNMIPLFETNRGCPFGCTYCTWGIAALSKVRCRSLDVIYEEMDYVALKSAKQVNWIFCDANFGILKRDIEIAKKIRQLMDENGFPINVTLWHSKNTGGRNIEIAKTIKNCEGYIAIQSTDPDVLTACGRGSIQPKHIMKQIDFYKENGFEVSTDILVGLPRETAASQLKTLMAAFDMGFGKIQAYNIRMLPGSQYESTEDRLSYGVRTKFRPIFGAYGVYAGQNTFEVEESVRATKDMSESELESFKILHWLIDFCWNIGYGKPVLRFAQDHGVNPGLILYELSSSKNPLLAGLFLEMKKQSTDEWLETKAAAVAFYEQQENFDELQNNFVKLNQLWIAMIYRNPEILLALQTELIQLIKLNVQIDDGESSELLDSLVGATHKLLCSDLLQEEFSIRERIPGNVLSYVLDNSELSNKGAVEVEIYRDKDTVMFCNFFLNQENKRDFSIQNLTRFFEMGGKKMLKNQMRLVD